MTSKQITRDEYMKNSSELHNDFYSQFVTQETLHFVKNRIGTDKIKESKDPTLNDVQVKRYPYGGWEWDYSPINLKLARELGAVGKQSLPSPSTRTCVGKAAARIILQGE